MLPASTVFTAHDSIAIPAYPSHRFCCSYIGRSSSFKPGGSGSCPFLNIGVTPGRWFVLGLMPAILEPSLKLVVVGRVTPVP